MKPIVLEMQAFGPFAHCQKIDFRLLGDKTFFLIHGPTGSGKTTLLDGICFALFGDTSGGEREARQMRSHHADNATLTSVSFDFALGEQHYRVQRVPEQMRRALRGSGEVRQLPQAQLWKIAATGDEVPVASGIAEVTRKIVELLGFESRQFRQVIMLPQGRFREFLMASSQERELILQTLFGTELYKRLEETLKAQAQELTRRSELVRTQRETLLQQAGVASEDALQALIAEQQDGLAQRTLEAEAARRLASDTQKRLTEAELVATRFKELDGAAADQQGLEAAKPAWARKEGECKLAQAAARLMPCFTAAEEAGANVKRLAEAAAALAREQASASQAQTRALAARDLAREQAPQVDGTLKRISELEQMAARAQSLASIRAQHQQAEAALRSVDLKVEAEKRRLREAQEKLASLANDIQRLEIVAAGQSGLALKLKQAQSSLAAHQELLKARARLEQLERTHASARQLLEAAEKQLQAAAASQTQVRSAWVASQAARLAHTLKTGCPCPVCGSEAHPDPADADSTPTTDQQLQEAENAFNSADAALAQQRRQEASAASGAAGQKERVAAIEQALGALAGQPSARFEQALSAVDSEFKAAEAATASLATLKKQAEDGKATVMAIETWLTAEQSRMQALSAEVQGLAGQIQANQTGIPRELATGEAIAAAIGAAREKLAELRARAERADAELQSANEQLATLKARMASNQEELARAKNTQSAKQADFSQQLSALGFADKDSFLASSMAPAELSALEQEIRRYSETLATAEARLQRARLEVARLERPDLPALKTLCEQAQAAQLEKARQVQAATGSLQAAKTLKDALDELKTSFAALEARYAVVKRLADVANGQNAQRMSFQRYVLATLLEEVLAATTQRLQIMSRRRYEMRRRSDPLSLRTAAGLDLEIFDQYTGMTRPVSTLSGGESFLASLALALGLSDVVQSYAGGIRLDAIFVDEGFGTLDPEALDFAIRALKDLQQAGRLVGIISHVAELKEWIDARLVLSSTQTGSSAAFEGV